MKQSAPGGAHARFARVVSGVDPELVSGIAGQPVGAPLGVAAERALAAIMSVLTSQEVAAASIELWLVLQDSEAAVLSDLAARVEARMPDGTSVAVRSLFVGDDLGGSLGDRVDVFASGLVSEDGQARHVHVFVHGTGGTAEIRRALVAMADAWGLPVLLVNGEAVNPRHAVGEVTSSLLLEALRFALTAERSPERDREILRRGFEGLVGRSESFYRATDTLDTLLMEERFIGLPDRYSACADLLRRHGEPELAAQLRALIDRWLRHRIWDVNRVHEMVLHDEAHSAGVDRNVASLCEPLLDADRPPITTWDVFVLALCAWLHDWGHASATVDGGMPTDPVEVRQYHGLLTAQRLAEQPEQHGISDDLVPAEDRTETPKLVSEVALLCSHHQGWTSCSALPPTDTFRPLRDFSVIGGRKFADDKAKKADLLGVHRSFDVDFERRLGKSATRGRDLGHLAKLLALLRLADAADIGVHRVPHFSTQHVNRNAELKAMLGQIELMVDLRASIAAMVSKEEFHQHGDVADFRAVRDCHAHLAGVVESKAIWDEAEIEQEIDKNLTKNDLKYWQSASSPDDSVGQQLIRWGSNYALHVVRQAAFYQHHRRVRAVIPTLRQEGSTFELALTVVPLPLDGDSSRAGSREAVVERVAKDVLREYGRVREDGEVKPDPGSRDKEPLSDLLRRLKINPDELRMMPYEPRDSTAATAAVLPPSVRLRMPYARSTGEPVSWCEWGADGPQLVPLAGISSKGAARELQPVALTSDGAQAAACPQGWLKITDVATGSVLRKLRVADDAAVLALRRSQDGFSLVLTEGGDVLSAWVTGTGSGSTVSRTAESPTPVRAVYAAELAHHITQEGTLTGPLARWMAPESSARWFDAISLGDRVVWALVPAGVPSEVLVWSGVPAIDPPRMDDVRDEKAPENDGRPVSELAWVREPHDAVARLVVVRDGIAAIHTVTVEP